MHSAVAIANHLIACAKRDGVVDLNSTKIHHLVYIAHGWHLGVRGGPLIAGRVMAHRDGVFINDLRESGCTGTKRVEAPIAVVETDEARGVMVESQPVVPPGDPAVPALEWVWRTYGRLTPYELSSFAREHGSPWDLIWNDERRDDDEPCPIPNGTIRAWFREQVAQTPGASEGVGYDETQTLLEKPDPNRLRAV